MAGEGERREGGTATYIVECFWPGVTEEKMDVAAARARWSAEELTRAGSPVRYVGSILVPVDEIVFFQFDGDSADAVRKASEQAGIPFERIVESVQRGDYR